MLQKPIVRHSTCEAALRKLQNGDPCAVDMDPMRLDARSHAAILPCWNDSDCLNGGAVWNSIVVGAAFGSIEAITSAPSSVWAVTAAGSIEMRNLRWRYH